MGYLCFVFASSSIIAHPASPERYGGDETTPRVDHDLFCAEPTHDRSESVHAQAFTSVRGSRPLPQPRLIVVAHVADGVAPVP